MSPPTRPCPNAAHFHAFSHAQPAAEAKRPTESVCGGAIFDRRERGRARSLSAHSPCYNMRSDDAMPIHPLRRPHKHARSRLGHERPRARGVCARRLERMSSIGMLLVLLLLFITYDNTLAIFVTSM
eukprot:1279184-Pleurochrysis_carterae.AAC.2